MTTRYQALSTAAKHRMAHDDPRTFAALHIEHLSATGASKAEIQAAHDRCEERLAQKRKADEVAAAQRRADDDLIRRAESNYASLSTNERHRLALLDRPRFLRIHNAAMRRAGLPMGIDMRSTR